MISIEDIGHPDAPPVQAFYSNYIAPLFEGFVPIYVANGLAERHDPHYDMMVAHPHCRALSDIEPETLKRFIAWLHINDGAINLRGHIPPPAAVRSVCQALENGLH